MADVLKMNKVGLENNSVLVVNDKIQTFKQKIESWKTCPSPPHDLDSFSAFKDFSDEIGGDINECKFLKLKDKMCQHLEDLHIIQQTNILQ